MNDDVHPIRVKQSPIAYIFLVCLQTVAATALFLMIFPVFQNVIQNSGQPQHLPASFLALVIAAALTLQVGYWIRYLRVPLWTPFRSALIGHILMFASRASFFFGGALFSAIFFRHLPQLESLPPMEQGASRRLGSWQSFLHYSAILLNWKSWVGLSSNGPSKYC